MPAQRVFRPDDVFSLRSVGFIAGPPVQASKVLLLPPVVDTTGIQGQPTRGRSRVDIGVRTRRRLLEELSQRARRLGATGLIDVRFAEDPFASSVLHNVPGDLVALSAVAVPIMTTSGHVPETGFRTALCAGDVSKLMRAGWIPVDVLVAGTTRTRAWRHRAADAAAVTSRQNQEIPGATDMVGRARSQLRDRVAASARALGADGVLLHGDFEAKWSSTHHLVQVMVTADVIARWGPPAREQSHPVLFSTP